MPMTAERQAEIAARVAAEISRGVEQLRTLEALFAESRNPTTLLLDQLTAAGLTGDTLAHVFRVACAYAADELRREKQHYCRGAA